MLIALLTISIFAGALAMGVAMMMSAPFWVALLAYPVGGMMALFLAAAATTIAPRLRSQTIEPVALRTRA